MTDRTAAETEIKLRATAPIEVAQLDAIAREAGFASLREGVIEHQDCYLDDAARTLAASGIGLRVRRTLGNATVCSKSEAGQLGLAVVRSETEAEWAAMDLPGAAQELPTAVRDTVEPLLLLHPLHLQLQLTVRRERAELQRGGVAVAEFVLDHVTASVGDRRAEFTEVEMEIWQETEACQQLGDALLAALPLTVVRDSKLAHGAALLDLPVPATDETLPVEASPSMVLRARLLDHFTAMARQEIGVRLADEPESLHCMRVENRRLRALVRAFRDHWPEDDSRWLRSELLAIGRALGEVRDLDVLVQATNELAPRLPVDLVPLLAPFQVWLEARRQATRVRLLAGLRTPEHVRGLQRLRDTMLRAAPPATEEVLDVRHVVAPRLRKTTRLVRRLLRVLPAELPLLPLHELRIAGKRLRYLVEEFAPFLGDDVRRALQPLARMQQSLGQVCDHSNAAHTMTVMARPFAAASEDGLSAAALLGALAALHEDRARKARRAAGRTLARTDRKRFWRALSTTWKN